MQPGRGQKKCLNVVPGLDVSVTAGDARKLRVTFCVPGVASVLLQILGTEDVLFALLESIVSR